MGLGGPKTTQRIDKNVRRLDLSSRGIVGYVVQALNTKKKEWYYGARAVWSIFVNSSVFVGNGRNFRRNCMLSKSYLELRASGICKACRLLSALDSLRQ